MFLRAVMPHGRANLHTVLAAGRVTPMRATSGVRLNMYEWDIATRLSPVKKSKPIVSDYQE